MKPLLTPNSFKLFTYNLSHDTTLPIPIPNDVYRLLNARNMVYHTSLIQLGPKWQSRLSI